jgi:UDP-N-acetylglucosamine 2-epimerase
VGSETRKIVDEVRHLVKRKPSTKRMRMFGNGKAGEKIVRILAKHSEPQN